MAADFACWEKEDASQLSGKIHWPQVRQHGMTVGHTTPCSNAMMDKHLEAMDKWLDKMEEVVKAVVDSMKEMWDNFELLQDFD